jgi:hypothetical protein
MNVTTRSALAAAAIFLAGTALVGCTPDAASSEAGPTPSASASATATPAPAENYGDITLMLDADGKPVTVTDEHGTYARTTISATAAAMSVDPATLDMPAGAPWSADDILSAQQWVAKFIVEEFLDSRAFDTKDGWSAWKADEGQRYVNTGFIDLEKGIEETGRSAIILNSSDKATIVSPRDGEPRFVSTEINVTDVANYEENGGIYIRIAAETSSVIRVTDAAFIRSVQEANPGSSMESIEADFPAYTDGVDGTWSLDADIEYFLEKIEPSGWRIVGFNTDWEPEFER